MKRTYENSCIDIVCKTKNGELKPDKKKSKPEGIQYTTNGHSSSAKVTDSGDKIYFTGGVDGKSIQDLIKIIDDKNNAFKKLKREHAEVMTIEPKPIYLYIQTYGGSLLPTFGAIDAIRSSIIPIYTVINGYAASAGTLLAVVGAKRYMTNNSFVLIHQLSSGMIGNMEAIKDDFKNCETFMETIYDIYEKHTSLTRKELEETLKRDLWWKKDKCLAHGLVDEIL